MKTRTRIAFSGSSARAFLLVGAGIPLFGMLQRDISLTHVATRHYASGLVQSENLVAV